MTARAITKAYDALPCSTRAKGSQWYSVARGQAQRIACESGHPTANVCGVIARLSPGVNWEANVLAARELCLFGEIAGYQGYPQNVERARVVLAEGWTVPARGPKIDAFFRNLCDPSDPEPVTLDRHMLRLIEWPMLEEGRAPWPAEYKRLAKPWREAAAKLGVVTCHVQAALWLAVRDDGEVPF